MNLVLLIAQGGLFGIMVSQAGFEFGDPTGLLLTVANSVLVVWYGVTQK